MFQSPHRCFLEHGICPPPNPHPVPSTAIAQKVREMPPNQSEQNSLDKLLLDFPSLLGLPSALRKLSLLISVTFHLSQALALDNLGFRCLSAFTK